MIKKLLAGLLAFTSLFTSTVFGFTYPTPDWGALLQEKREMVNQTEFELYIEGNINSAPYFGAKLEPRSGAYIGMVAENSVDFAPLSSYLTYIEDMDQNDLYSPANVMIKNDSVVATIGWTIHSLDNVDYDKVRSVLNTLNQYNKPMFIRFANEMNVSDLGSNPYRYVEIFRTVADMIHEYPNFAVVWSPNDLGALDRPFHYFYPGDEYVDWIGISSYMKRYFQGNKNTDEKSSIYFMIGDYAWATNAIKPILEFMEENNIQKPLMISEGGVATNNSYGEDMTAWATPRLGNMYWYLVMKYPQIKLINNFNNHRYMEIERFDISNYPYASDIFKEASDSGAYIRSFGDEPDFVFSPANNGETITAKDNIVRLYTLAYVPKQPELSVNYYIDGSWFHAGYQIPYICDMDISCLTDGEHILSIRTTGMERDYTFYKRGNLIRFGAEPEYVITVTLNEKHLEFDQPPIMVNDRVLVPLRVIFEELGATVTWDEKKQIVTAKRDNTKISLQIDSDKLYVNDDFTILDVPAQLINDRTLVPVRAISESFDCTVDWDGINQEVVINE